MCQTVRVDNQECDTPRQLAKAIGCSIGDLVPISWLDCAVDAACLCPVDVPATASKHGFTATDYGLFWKLDRRKDGTNEPEGVR